MTDASSQKCYFIDRDKLPADFPTHHHEASFWEELGRTVAAYGFMEEMLGKAIFALTGAKEFDPQGDPNALDAWIKTLEKALTDQLGGLIIAYDKALAENPRTKTNDFSQLIAGLKRSKDIRNALCHGSWDLPNEQGQSIPKFVNRKLQIFETPVDIQFLYDTRRALRHFICDIMDSVTAVGYKFPGSGSPGEQLWPHPNDVVGLGKD